jgi:hypothetical protein
MAERAVFTTDDVGRVFLGCKECRRIMPHYRAYGPATKRGVGQCKCGSTMFRPIRIAEIRAAWWVVVVGWLWRKTIRKETLWDPRMPVRQA